MTEAILAGMAVASIIVGIAFLAFAYGLKCGRQMQQIPKLAEPRPKSTVEEEANLNAGPYG